METKETTDRKNSDLSGYLKALDQKVALLKALHSSEQAIFLHDPITNEQRILMLNSRRQMVVLNTMPNGAKTEEVFDQRHAHLLVNPADFTPEHSSQSKEVEDFRNLTLARSIKTIIDHKDSPLNNESEKQEKIQKAAKHLSSVLAEKLRMTRFYTDDTVETGHHGELMIIYKANTSGQDSVDALRKLIESTGSTYLKNLPENIIIKSVIPSRNFAHFAISYLVKRLIEEFGKTVEISGFKRNIESQRMDQFAAKIELDNKGGMITLSIKILIEKKRQNSN